MLLFIPCWQTWELRRLSFEEGCKVHTILSQEPDVNGELIPVPISEKIIQLMVSLVTDVMNEYKPMFHVDAGSSCYRMLSSHCCVC